MYFKLGKILNDNYKYGNKFIDYISRELKLEFPNIEGFSVRNLKYMKKFYLEYKDDKEVQQLVAQVPWGHNIVLMEKVKDKEVEYGLSIIKDFALKASKLKREEVDLSELCIGLKCGGSDAFSGITANPLVGKVSDRLISLGGSSILTEVPEMFGAEQVLMNKCKDEKTFRNYKDLIENFKKYYRDFGYPIYENPSPGNKEGGITTLEEKSLGCVTKAGASTIVDVLKYGDLIKETGLNILEAPGNDLIASTALAAAGAQLVLFTTGRGTPFSTIVPTIKIATNNHLYENKKHWIDFDASSLDEDALFKLVLDTASGSYKTKQEDSHEIAFFKKGVIL